ncbi:bifunctional diguanylate cyclase/phosphodiesterase [Sphingomonas sp. BK069]|uniref:putative bifunctional diguanylate cyclase/phosphodiesterase n=1 Tax=Sphingomonas sp. BK069 TaxID=2586979 RepID=UPI00160E374F|nr:EAL domain-containing protein [Sphingomonas sp. BK069]MBB3349861.1 diguanylate cyclase (GGDEF)-like protein [Sphingomonas sp. BK069]
MAVALCLGTLIYVQHTTSVIVDRDMETALTLSEIAASFDHEDGSLYRVMVDKAADGATYDIGPRVDTIHARVSRIRDLLVQQRGRLSRRDRRRVDRVILELNTYNDAVSVLSSMLEVDFATSVAMLRPFRANANKVLTEVKGIARSGITDAHRHAEAAAWRTRILVIVVIAAVLIVGLLSYLWLAIAAARGVQLQEEVRRRGEAEREALVLARTDALTGLVNRRVFSSELQAAVDAATADVGELAVVLIDLDGFKEANDCHGHAAGDAILRAVARRLTSIFGADSTIARLGGDEFGVLVPVAHCGPAIPLAEVASVSLRAPVGWLGNMLTTGASIGVSQYPRDGREPDELLHAADVAMYHAKRNMKGGVCRFNTTMEAERLERRRLEGELRDGIERGEVRPFYQPIVHLVDRTVCGFEVLARWQHPRLGLLTPDSFIRLAETTRQITALTRRILTQACSDLADLPSHIRLAINISPTQLMEPDLAASLIAIIQEHGVDPARIEIEITEDAVMDDVLLAESVLQTFRNAGMSIALDDFGTGYSSLANLRRLRFDKIKIDQTFVRTLHGSVESEKLVDAILSLAASFGMAVTAEGIEDEKVAGLLSGKGCTRGQGYLFGRPAALVDVLPLCAERHCEAA